MVIERQEKILELINLYEIETQEELAEKLNASGYTVTQATISRDIRALKLYKKSIGGGRQKYAIDKADEEDFDKRYFGILQQGFVSINSAQNILVIKTVSGMAMAVAAAIDHLHYPEIVGTIAGDDTIMMAIRNNDDAFKVMSRILAILKEEQ
ncbi:MAG: arginine repressor [Lachnospiraceae bacterium]|nr:arginine repressor [Lachnospiraceae bacterium]